MTYPSIAFHLFIARDLLGYKAYTTRLLTRFAATSDSSAFPFFQPLFFQLAHLDPPPNTMVGTYFILHYKRGMNSK